MCPHRRRPPRRCPPRPRPRPRRQSSLLSSSAGLFAVVTVVLHVAMGVPHALTCVCVSIRVPGKWAAAYVPGAFCPRARGQNFSEGVGVVVDAVPHVETPGLGGVCREGRGHGCEGMSWADGVGGDDERSDTAAG